MIASNNIQRHTHKHAGEHSETSEPQRANLKINKLFVEHESQIARGRKQCFICTSSKSTLDDVEPLLLQYVKYYLFFHREDLRLFSNFISVNKKDVVWSSPVNQMATLHSKHPDKPAIPTPDCFLKTIKAYCLFVWKPWISLTFQWECFTFPWRSFTNLNLHSGSFFVTFVGVDLIKQSDDVTVTNHRLIQIIQTSRKVSRMQKYFFLPQQPGLAVSW